MESVLGVAGRRDSGTTGAGAVLQRLEQMIGKKKGFRFSYLAVNDAYAMLCETTEVWSNI